MTDTPIFGDDEEVEPGPPIPFGLRYRDAEGQSAVADLTALPLEDVPYIWILEYFAAGTGDIAAQSAAQVQFFDRVLTADSRAKFLAIIHDPTARVRAKTLQDLSIYLLERYQPMGPTPARSAGRKPSRPTSSSNGRGSRAGRDAKRSTSR